MFRYFITLICKSSRSILENKINFNRNVIRYLKISLVVVKFKSQITQSEITAAVRAAASI